MVLFDPIGKHFGRYQSHGKTHTGMHVLAGKIEIPHFFARIDTAEESCLKKRNSPA